MTGLVSSLAQQNKDKDATIAQLREEVKEARMRGGVGGGAGDAALVEKLQKTIKSQKAMLAIKQQEIDLIRELEKE